MKVLKSVTGFCGKAHTNWLKNDSKMSQIRLKSVENRSKMTEFNRKLTDKIDFNFSSTNDLQHVDKRTGTFISFLENTNLTLSNILNS